MKLQKVPFENILNGRKVIESRLYDEKRRQVNVDDQIDFTCTTEPTRKVSTKVKALYKYESFEKLFSDFPAEDFGGQLKDELVREIESFYSKDDQHKYGVIGIRIELI